MKKNILFLLTLLFFIAVDAQAQEWAAQKNFCYDDGCCLNEMKFYGQIFGGANFLQNTPLNGSKAKYDTGYIIGGSLGWYWCYGLRIEGEYSYRRDAIKEIHFFGQGSSNDGNFHASSCMANLLWDFPTSFFCYVRPFLGAGIGYDFQKIHASNSRIDFNQKWNHFSWQMMAGFAYEIFCDTELALEYKFHQGGCHFNNHSIGVGLVYKFGFFR